VWEAEVIARDVYEELGCQGVASIDLIAGDHGTQLLEVNTVPTFSRATPLAQQLEQAHFHPTKMIDSLLRQTL
jgi:D-alanine-D-alanine ligase-like ATP-grasp enzyme